MAKKSAKGEKAPAFEETMELLETIATELETGELPLEKAIERYEQGVKAYRLCHKILADAEKKVEVLTRTANGDVVAQDFESDTDGSSDEREAEEDEGPEESGRTGPSLF